MKFGFMMQRGGEIFPYEKKKPAFDQFVDSISIICEYLGVIEGMKNRNLHLINLYI